MEYVWELLPYVGFGFMGAILARFSGVALCMLIAPCVLYMGATPLEFLTFMLTFALYHTFSSATQEARLDLKQMKLFPGWKVLIPLVLSVILSFLNPYVSVAVFLLCFLGELGAAMYGRLPAHQRPTLSEMTKMSLGATVVSGIGVAIIAWLVQAVTAVTTWFFAWIAVAIIAASFVIYWLSQHRSVGRNAWGLVITSLFAFFGMAGLELTSYFPTIKRTYPTRADKMVPIYLCVAAVLVTLGITLYSQEERAYLPAIITALGSTFGIRLFGLYEHTERGKLSIVALVGAVLVGLLLALVEPAATGIVGSW